MNETSETLLDKAIQNYNVALVLYTSQLAQDEVYLNYVGYHLQQSVELSIKHFLEVNGYEFEYSHDINILIKSAKDNDINWGNDEYIIDHSEMISSWESKTRYIKNYGLETEKIDKAIHEIGHYLEEAKEIDKDLHTEHEQPEPSKDDEPQDREEAVNKESSKSHAEELRDQQLLNIADQISEEDMIIPEEPKRSPIIQEEIDKEEKNRKIKIQEKEEKPQLP